MPKQKNKIIIITGPSASGKTTVGLAILKKIKKLKKVTTFTTRKKRPAEKSGRDYYFISENKFKGMIKKKDFIEWARVYNHYYGNAYSELENIWKENKTPLLIIDVQGALTYQKKLPQTKVIFLKPALNDNLAKRIVGRSKISARDLRTRLKTVKKEITLAKKFDYIVSNPEGKLGQTIENMAKLINKLALDTK